MSRPPRLHVPDGCYHVTLRGNHREAIFGSLADRDRLDEFVADALDRFGVRLHAYCWMTNHLHALVQIGEQQLGKFVQSFATRYARYRHKALNTSGHLFERRHDTRLIQVESYFLAVLRYIHLNPVKAGIVGNPGDYPWSSHRAYLGTRSIDWVTTELGLSLLGPDPQSARRAYASFVDDQTADGGEDLDDKAHPDDARILGDEEYVAKLRRPPTPSKDEPRPEPGHGQPGPEPGLDALAAALCDRHGISVELLRSKASMRGLTPIRLELLDQAARRGVATLSEVARYLGRDPSTLCKQRQQRAAKRRKERTAPRRKVQKVQ